MKLEDIEEDVFRTIKGVARSKEPIIISPDVHLTNDLGLDSLDIAELHVSLEARHAHAGYNSDEVDVEKLMYAREIVNAVAEFYRKAGQLSS